MQQPKNIIKKFNIRNHSYGKERRLNLTKQTLDKRIHFPKAVEYKDIDQAVFDWVDKDLAFSHDGIKYPTYKLFSTQRISEYGQEWEKLDEKGNLEINFRSLTREPNPQKGDSQGSYMVIPGHREYPVFNNYVTNESGITHIERYTMKQPTAVNFIYTINLVTSSYSALNKFNNMVHYEFNAIQRYIFPNGFAMPMTLESVSDESEYAIDDRKYYAQSYQIKLSGFIIREEDYNVHIIPIRERKGFFVGINRPKKETEGEVEFINNEEYVTRIPSVCSDDQTIEVEKINMPFDEQYNPISGHSNVEYEEVTDNTMCSNNAYGEDDGYYRELIVCPIQACNPIYELTDENKGDYNWVLEQIELENIKEFKLLIDDVEIDFEENDVEFGKGNRVVIQAVLENPFKDGTVSMLCFDPDATVKEE